MIATIFGYYSKQIPILRATFANDIFSLRRPSLKMRADESQDVSSAFCRQ